VDCVCDLTWDSRFFYRVYLFDGLIGQAFMSVRWIKIGGVFRLVAIGSAAMLVASRWPFTHDTAREGCEKASTRLNSESFA